MVYGEPALAPVVREACPVLSGAGRAPPDASARPGLWPRRDGDYPGRNTTGRSLYWRGPRPADDQPRPKTDRRQPGPLPISYVVADATALPFAGDAFDATTGHSFLYLVPNRAGVLDEAYRVLRCGGRYVSMEPRDGKNQGHPVLRHWHDLRYLVSIVLWRPYSRIHGRLTESNFPTTLARAGFKDTGTTPVLEGLGIIGVGEKRDC